ncbi:MAG TPA: GntR family transcriptional regulator [Rhodopila sp.]|jgi:DNA-binding GntR family transcriptional regulator
MAELLRDSVYRALRQAILSWEFRPGQELREQVLAERYRVSRSPVRDSLLRLEQEKLVTVLPRQGYRVNPVGLRDIEELFGLRMVIAPACAAEAARADDAAVRTLDRFRDSSMEAIGGAIDDAAFAAYNREFHGAVASLAGNSRLAAVETALAEEFDRLVLIVFKALRDRVIPEVLAEHSAIIDAIQAHDSDTASQGVRTHIISARRRIMAIWSMNGGQQDYRELT